MTRIPVVRPKWQPTARNIQVLAAVCATGDDRLAGESLVDAKHPNGISARVVGQHIRLFLVGTPARSRAQLCLIWHDAIVAHVEHPE